MKPEASHRQEAAGSGASPPAAEVHRNGQGEGCEAATGQRGPGSQTGSREEPVKRERRKPSRYVQEVSLCHADMSVVENVNLCFSIKP